MITALNEIRQIDALSTFPRVQYAPDIIQGDKSPLTFSLFLRIVIVPRFDGILYDQCE